MTRYLLAALHVAVGVVGRLTSGEPLKSGRGGGGEQ